MKTKNRNKNFKTRLIRSTCFVAAGIVGASSIAAGIISQTSNDNASAADMSINRTGLNGIGENQIQVLSSKMSIDDAIVSTTGPIKKMRSKCYTVDEMENGTYDSERDSQVSYFSATENNCDTTNIVYDFGDSLSTGSHYVGDDGTISLTWSNAAHDADGNPYDVKMYVDNITIYNGIEAHHPISLLGLSEHAVRYATQERPASELSGSNYSLRIHNVGASYDVKVSIVNPGTNTPVSGKNTVYIMKDLDQPDGYTGGYGTTGSPTPYAESVTLIEGISGQVFIENNSVLNISDTVYGSDTRFSATIVTSTDSEIETSSVAFLGSASGFKYRWSGSDCGTAFGWIGSKKVITSTSGNYADKGKITVTDDEVLWKEDKKIVMTPDAGYKVSKVTVDGTPISFTPNANGVVEYTFNDVVSDHRIDVQFEPTTGYTLIVHHYLEGTEPPFSVADDVTKDGLTYDEHYTTEPAKNLDPKYELVKTPDNAEGDIKGNTEVIYYYRIVKGTVTVHHCKEGEDCSDPEPDPKVCAETGKKCEPLAEPEVSVCVRGDKVGIAPKTFDHYYLVDSPDFTEADCDTNPEDPKDPIIYHYGQNGTVEVRFCDKATGNCNLAPIETDEGKDGDISEICKPKTIAGYNLVDKNAEYDCFYSRDNNVVKIWYNKIINPITADNGIAGCIAGALGLVTATAGAIIYLIKRR